jgi:hypothetical protein
MPTLGLAGGELTMSRSAVVFVVVVAAILGTGGAVLVFGDHSADHNVPGKSTGAGRSSIASPEASD